MKQLEKKGLKNQVGAWGELIVANRLTKQGFQIIDTNYLMKWGEIDIVAREKETLHFIEVKTVSHETKNRLKWAISHETWCPEENVHRKKLERLGRTIQTWITEKSYTGNWQFDVAVVRIVLKEKYATVKWIGNVIID
jgi:putative endonuclease